MTASESTLLEAAERVRAACEEEEAIRDGAPMTMAEWRAMYHYTCSLPTSPQPGFVYARGPHKRGSDPTTDPWWRVEVKLSAEPGYVDHVPTRIVIVEAKS